MGMAEGQSPAQAGQHAGAMTRQPVPGVATATLLCAGFVLAADFLFYRRPVGWTVGLYGLLLEAAIVLGGSFARRAPAGLIGGATAVLLLWCSVEPGRLTVVLAATGLVSLGLLSREGWCGAAVVWFARWAAFLATGWTSLFADVVASHRGRKGGALGCLAKWAVPVVLSLVFLTLFAMANPIIADWLGRVPPPFGRVLLWALVAVWAWALLRFRSGIEDARRFDTASAALASRGLLSPAFVVRCLLLFNALFAVQTTLDARYLWGGAQLPAGMTYAGYAHRGAYPLVATALLAAVFVLAAFRADSQRRDMRWARMLVYLWLAQNVLLVVSAAWRLWLYVGAYSLTRLRVAAGIWMFLVACGLVWILVRICAGRSGNWLINVCTVTALAVLYACAFVAFGGLIADFNVRHCEEVAGEGPSIDVAYLESLGFEALPALERLSARVQGTAKAPLVRDSTARLQGRLLEDMRDWRGWTLRRSRLSVQAVRRSG
jgi:hypothetical protein